MFFEQCWFLWGFKIGPFLIGWTTYHSIGETCSVEFDWEKGLSKFLLGWFHTHPKEISLEPSQEDQKTMRAWVRTLERPLICGIKHETRYQTYLFKRNQDKKIVYNQLKSKMIKTMFIGIMKSKV
jgi:hypothetical protein